MSTYGQYCPIAKGAEVFADRWTPLILRELLAGVHRFTDLHRGLPGISRSLLVSRLRHLERAGVVERRPTTRAQIFEYHLTEGGRELRPVVMGLGEWAARRAFGDPEPTDLKPEVLMGWIARRVDRELLPPQRVVIGFDLQGAAKRWWWLVLQPADVSVCRQNLGFDVDLWVTADISDLYRVWLGRISFDEAVTSGLVRMRGAPSMRRVLPQWLALSPLAPAVRAGLSRRPPEGGA